MVGVYLGATADGIVQCELLCDELAVKLFAQSMQFLVLETQRARRLILLRLQLLLVILRTLFQLPPTHPMCEPREGERQV